MARTGRPRKYTPELAKQVCKYIMAGLTLRQLAKQPGIPSIQTLYNWLLDKNIDFFEQHTRARSVQAWGEVDDMLRLADEADPKTVNVKRLQVDVRKFRAERFNRAAFGDRREVKHTGNVAVVSIPIEALKGQQDVIEAEIVEEHETQEPKMIEA
jgi:hypothetical protein